jgi:hypothetical protein
VIEKQEIVESVREWKAQRTAELRLKVKLIQLELLSAIDDLQQHQKLKGEALIFAANNEGVEWNEEHWMEEMRALWTIPTHPNKTKDEPSNQAQTLHDPETKETNQAGPLPSPVPPLASHPGTVHAPAPATVAAHP